MAGEDLAPLLEKAAKGKRKRLDRTLWEKLWAELDAPVLLFGPEWLELVALCRRTGAVPLILGSLDADVKQDKSTIRQGCCSKFRLYVVRGVFRADVGDAPGAIEDFESFLEHSGGVLDGRPVWPPEEPRVRELLAELRAKAGPLPDAGFRAPDLPDDWWMGSRRGNQAITRLAKHAVEEVRSAVALDPAARRREVEAALRRFVQEWERLGETDELAAASDTDVREIVGDFHDALAEASGVFQKAELSRLFDETRVDRPAR